MRRIDQLVRNSIKGLKPYSSARDEFSETASVYLDANENPFNAPYNRYPDPTQEDLKKKIAALKSCRANELFLGNGSDEAIDLLYRVFCDPGKDDVLSISPSYGMYEVCAGVNNVRFRKVLLNEDFSLPVERILSEVGEATKLIFLCSPNNPTSNTFPEEDMLRIVREANAIVVVDEAYIDFSEQGSMSRYVGDNENLVVLQTFSKAYGLAAIRLGMAIGNPALIAYMNRIKYPYNLNKLTMDFASEVLQEEGQVAKWVGEIIQERKRLERKMKMFRFVEEIYPSDANFLLVKVSRPRELYDFLVSREIIVRDRSSQPLCEGCLRVTVGSREENDALLEGMGGWEARTPAAAGGLGG